MGTLTAAYLLNMLERHKILMVSGVFRGAENVGNICFCNFVRGYKVYLFQSSPKIIGGHQQPLLDIIHLSINAIPSHMFQSAQGGQPNIREGQDSLCPYKNVRSL